MDLKVFGSAPLERAKKLDRGELLEPEKILTFENAFKTLTRARIGVYRKVKERKSVSRHSLTASTALVRRSVAM